jgi:polyisoprenoid-binding protein YceI
VSTRIKAVGTLAGAGILAIAAFATWFFVLRDDGADSATSQGAVEALESQQSQAGAAVTTTAQAQPVDVAGAWTVDTTLGDRVYPFDQGSYVGYRVVEELGGVGANTAVGRTPAVTGSLNITGTQIVDVSIVANFTELVSDSDSRDDALREEALETEAFPEASFTVTQPIELGKIPADGETINVEAIGDLTLHGVTKQTTVPLEATLVGDTIAVIGRASITFADYDIDKPTSALVISIKDVGELELQLFFSRSSAG